MILFQSIFDPLSNNDSIDLQSDQYGTPTLVDDMAKCVLEMVNSNCNGIFHCAGSDVITRYEFGTILAEVFDLNKDLIKPVVSKQQRAVRPKNSSLNTEKIQNNTSIRFLGLRDGLNYVKKQINKLNGRIVLE
jgi:dTDP-4-dehydrorhamnose reductase